MKKSTSFLSHIYIFLFIFSQSSPKEDYNTFGKPSSYPPDPPKVIQSYPDPELSKKSSRDDFKSTRKYEDKVDDIKSSSRSFPKNISDPPNSGSIHNYTKNASDPYSDYKKNLVENVEPKIVKSYYEPVDEGFKNRIDSGFEKKMEKSDFAKKMEEPKIVRNNYEPSAEIIGMGEGNKFNFSRNSARNLDEDGKIKRNEIEFPF